AIKPISQCAALSSEVVQELQQVPEPPGRGESNAGTAVNSSHVLVQLCDPPCTLDQGGVENEWLPKSQCANVEKTECGLVGRNAPGVPVPCSILYSVIESIEAG
ncbi:hypothetical protein ABVT39_025130, partial [Epinephelus coioides]